MLITGIFRGSTPIREVIKMIFWKLTIKYHKLAIPDVILFSDNSTAEYYKQQKEGQQNVVWVTVSEKPIELPVTIE